MLHVTEPDTDADELVRGVARGERSALASLFQQEAGRLIAIARRIVRTRELSEEVVQDAFVLVWQRAGQFDASRGSARTWLARIVRNRALNLLRDGARLDYHDEASLADIGDRNADAAEAFDRLADGDALKQCLGRLDELKRRAIVLCYVTGMSHGEVAATIGAPLGTVKAWIRRGMIALQECLS